MQLYNLIANGYWKLGVVEALRRGELVFAVPNLAEYLLNQ